MCSNRDLNPDLDQHFRIAYPLMTSSIFQSSNHQAYVLLLCWKKIQPHQQIGLWLLRTCYFVKQIAVNHSSCQCLLCADVHSCMHGIWQQYSGLKYKQAYNYKYQYFKLVLEYEFEVPSTTCLKGKGSPYSITERRVPELIPVLGSQPAGDVSHKPGGRLPLLSAGLQLPPQPLRGMLPVLLLGERRHSGCEQFAYKTVTRQRRDCDLNPGPTAPESSTLTTRSAD